MIDVMGEHTPTLLREVDTYSTVMEAGDASSESFLCFLHGCNKPKINRPLSFASL